MIGTSDEGTSHCPQCEVYAKRNEKLEAVALAAAKLIYAPRMVYAANSKKSKLKAALEALAPQEGKP